MKRGQALVEMALILPIFLVMILGSLMLGLMLVERMELTHAAQEGAVAGASNPGDACGLAISTAGSVHGYTTAACEVQGQIIEVTLSRTLPMLVPLWTDAVTVTVTERAALR